MEYFHNLWLSNCLVGLEPIGFSNHPRPDSDGFHREQTFDQVFHTLSCATLEGRFSIKLCRSGYFSCRIGRKEIEIAEHEMPGLMAIGDKFSKDKPLSGVKRVTGSLHMTIQTAVLIRNFG